MTEFVQLVEMTTTRFDEMQRYNEEWREANPDMMLDWAIFARDRDHPDQYVAIVHFDSFEVAMKNSDDPRTAEFAAKMSDLCDGQVAFRNLDVMSTEGRLADQG